MKLHFPQGDHKDIELTEGSYTIGSAENNDVNIQDKGLGAIHATLTLTDGECVLTIDNEARLTSVNGKLVTKSKELREGDLIIAAQVHMKLASSNEVEEEEDDNRTRVRMALPKFVLRGVSGAYFGKTYPLRGTTIMGRHSECHICVNADGISRKHVQIDAEADGLVATDLGSSNGTYINGNKIDKAELKVGDELRLDNIRFLIQTPGMTDPALENQSSDAKTKKAPRPETPAVVEKSSGGVKWLVTFLVLGGAVAVAWQMGYLNGLLG